MLIYKKSTGTNTLVNKSDIINIQLLGKERNLWIKKWGYIFILV